MSVPSLFPIAISLNSEIGKLFLEIEPWSRSKPVPVAESTSPCHLDLVAELVGGVAATCGTGGAPLRWRAERRAREAPCAAAPSQGDVRHGALLLRHPAPPDRLALLPRRVRRRSWRRGQERHAYRWRWTIWRRAAAMPPTPAASDAYSPCKR